MRRITSARPLARRTLHQPPGPCLLRRAWDLLLLLVSPRARRRPRGSSKGEGVGPAQGTMESGTRELVREQRELYDQDHAPTHLVGPDSRTHARRPGRIACAHCGRTDQALVARRIETPEAAPDICRSGGDRDRREPAASPTACSPLPTPASSTRTTEKLLCAYADEIAIVETAERRTAQHGLPAGKHRPDGDGLHPAELVVRESWGRMIASRRTVTIIKFNTVTDYLLVPLLDRWRSVQEKQRGVTGAGAGQVALCAASTIDSMNIARVILPGDCVLASIMQPELRTPMAELFGHVYSRSRAPAHVVVLTDRELIVAAEEKPSLRRDTSRYGSVATYVPAPRFGASP